MGKKINPLKLWLIKKNITAADLARSIGYTPTSLRNYITGTATISNKGAKLIEMATEGEIKQEVVLRNNPLINDKQRRLAKNRTLQDILKDM